MTLYESLELETMLEKLIEEKGGEISEDEFKDFILAQTVAGEKLENLCKWVRNLEYFADNCNAEKKRISEKKDGAEKKIEQIKKFINPYILAKGGKVTAGIFQLSSRKSETVEIFDRTILPKKFIKKKIEESIDKVGIKEALKNNKKVPGAKIESHDNTQIK